IGAGKAGAPMAQALEELLKEYPVSGLVAVKYGHTAPTNTIDLIEAGHPLPDENSRRAADEVAELLGRADSDTLVFNLISGGGSALLSRPVSEIPSADLQDMNTVLLDCGAEIHEINTLRKHVSGIKGGRLAEMAYPCRLINIILSDVIGDDLEVIASGPAVPDPSTFTNVQNIVDTYQIRKKLPQSIINYFDKGLHDPSLETPKADNPCFQRVQTVLLGNNRSALEAAAAYTENERRGVDEPEGRGGSADNRKPEKEGLRTIILTSRMSGEAREIAKLFSAIALDPPGKNLLVLAGGETTVRMRGKGKGGRNQELALSYLDTILRSGLLPAACFLAAGSDGNDGPTDAAGAVICSTDISRLAASGPSPAAWLADNNSYEYLSENGIIYKPGPTNTNVCDFCFLYIHP
ncbi:MAG: glycerate kinase type-2 family protein, partial [Salinispira sp.]